MLPLTFSIILPCRNPGPVLSKAVESVLQQSGASFELLVIDGDSPDGTVAWLKAQNHPSLHFISEPDAGIYDAMNKGVRQAKGEWLLFLGADDRLASSNVLALVSATIVNSHHRLFCGAVHYSDGRSWPAPTKLRPIYRNFIHHQATFYHRSVFENRSYDTSFAIQSDYDLNLHLWTKGILPAPLPFEIALCRSGGLSDEGRWQNYREEIAIRHRYFPSPRCMFWDALSVLRYLRKKTLRSQAMKRPE